MNPFNAEMQQMLARTRQRELLEEVRRDQLLRRIRRDRSRVVRTSWLKTALIRFWFGLKTAGSNPHTPDNET